MNFNLVFENSGDFISVEILHNHSFFEFYLDKIQSNSDNLFENRSLNIAALELETKQLALYIKEVNGLLSKLPGTQLLEEPNSINRAIDQDFLNKSHAIWVKNEFVVCNINNLRNNNDSKIQCVGDFLHAKYPDDIRIVTVSEIMDKFGLLNKFQEINMGIHRTERLCLENYEYSSDNKWNVFENTEIDNLETNNGVTNFNIGHTYVGRQNYDKFIHFDTDLTYSDFYNFEKIEHSFNFNLAKPQSMPFSKEFLDWSKLHNQKPKGLQIPIGNVVNLESNLTKYRSMLYSNTKNNNKVSIIV